MKWLIRRILKRIKQRHPIEVYMNGRLVQAGSGAITISVDEPMKIVFDEHFK